jgi:hypothetical protein
MLSLLTTTTRFKMWKTLRVPRTRCSPAPPPRSKLDPSDSHSKTELFAARLASSRRALRKSEHIKTRPAREKPTKRSPFNIPTSTSAALAGAARIGPTPQPLPPGAFRKDCLVPIEVAKGPLSPPDDPTHVRHGEDEWTCRSRGGFGRKDVVLFCRRRRFQRA